MKRENRDEAYMWDMLDFAKEAYKLVRRVTFAQLNKDSTRKFALERVMELLGEAARRVGEDVRLRHPVIDWRRLIGQRNVLAHDYGEIDHQQLYDSARIKVPVLIAELDRILGDDQ